MWVLAPLSGLLLLHPDGSIYSIRNHLALSLFGYNKDELLRKVSQLNMAMWNDNECQLSILSLLVVFNRVSRFWCPVSMDGCLTRTERPALSLNFMQRLLKAQHHPKYQNLVSICMCSRLTHFRWIVRIQRLSSCEVRELKGRREGSVKHSLIACYFEKFLSRNLYVFSFRVSSENIIIFAVVFNKSFEIAEKDFPWPPGHHHVGWIHGSYCLQPSNYGNCTKIRALLSPELKKKKNTKYKIQFKIL